MTDRLSWNKVPFWVKEIKEREPGCALYVCGTKEDLLDSHERAIDELVVSRFCTDYQAQYFETSSRTGNNVDALFRAVAETFVRTHPDIQRSAPEPAGASKSRHADSREGLTLGRGEGRWVDGVGGSFQASIWTAPAGTQPCGPATACQAAAPTRWHEPSTAWAAATHFPGTDQMDGLNCLKQRTMSCCTIIPVYSRMMPCSACRGPWAKRPKPAGRVCTGSGRVQFTAAKMNELRPRGHMTAPLHLSTKMDLRSILFVIGKIPFSIKKQLT